MYTSGASFCFVSTYSDESETLVFGPWQAEGQMDSHFILLHWADRSAEVDLPDRQSTSSGWLVMTDLLPILTAC